MLYTDTVVPIEKIREAVATYGRPAREAAFRCPKSFELWRLRDRLLLFTALEVCRRMWVFRKDPDYYRFVQQNFSTPHGRFRLCRFPLGRRRDGYFYRRLSDKSYLNPITHEIRHHGGDRTPQRLLYGLRNGRYRLTRYAQRTILEVERKKAVLIPNTFVIQAWKHKLSAYGVRLYLLLLGTRRRDIYGCTVITYERLRRCGIGTGRRDVKRDRSETQKALQILKEMNLIINFTEDSKRVRILLRESE